MIIKDYFKNKYVYIEKKSEKDYYKEILYLKYNINIDESSQPQTKLLTDKIKKIYDKK